MKNLSYVANNLFNKIRGRFSDVTIGDEDGTVTNIPEEARYFDFSYMIDGVDLGKVSVNISEDTGLTVIMSQDFASGQTEDIQNNWYSFLKELRLFAKKNMMNFDVRDINKNNLTKRDYSFLANKTSGDETMAESKMYGTNKTKLHLPCALTWSRSNRWFVPHRLIRGHAEQGLLHNNSGHYYSL